MSPKPEALASGLSDVLGRRVENLHRLSGGASRETWAFEAVADDGTVEPLILRRETRGAMAANRVDEGPLLEAAAAAGVPVPRVVVDGREPNELGAPFLIVERIDGETIPRKILRDDEFASARPRLARQCGDVLARIHAIPTDVDAALKPEDPLPTWRSVLDGMGEAHPAFELGFRWLTANRPPPGRTTIVHGDFRNGNLIVGPDGIRAVLDWELAHLGDPMEDLGWLCVKAWRFGSPKRVGGFGDADDLYAAYEQASGTTVDPDVVRWWEVLGTLKWGIMCILQAFTHLSGAARSVELAAIGRRVCENEWDLLALIDETR